jgi:hypothetical protein
VTPRTRALAAIDDLEPLGLPDLERSAGLLRRLDHKYVVDWQSFAAVVGAVADEHRVLQIDGRRSFRYDTVYFDSEDLATFRAHVQGRRRRYKVRVRHYADSGLCSLELKLKGPRGQTIKHRVPYDVREDAMLTEAAARFVVEHLREAYGHELPGPLLPVLRTRYERITLVHRDGEQRLTCDHDLHYPAAADAATPRLSEEHIVVEAKSLDGRGAADAVLRDLGHRPVTCSKYLLGVGLHGLRPVPPDMRRLARTHFHTRHESRSPHA